MGLVFSNMKSAKYVQYCLLSKIVLKAHLLKNIDTTTRSTISTLLSANVNLRLHVSIGPHHLVVAIQKL